FHVTCVAHSLTYSAKQ
ncbi:PP-loop family protein, partial [Vibrio cholerae CP1035(8)]